MVALAAAYESYRSGVNRSEDIISRHNLAIRAFTSKPTSLDLSLILCRLFSSTAKRMGDWDSAAVHIHHGGNILREAHHQGKAVSELASLMAPTFLCTTENILGGDLGLQTIFKTQQAPLTILKTIHAEYSQTLRLVRRHKNDISSPNRSFLLIAWSVMTQAMYSTMHPDLMLFTTEDPIVPARQVKANLADSGSLLDLRDLEVTCLSLFREIRSSLVKSKQDRQMLNPLQERLKICVDNFVVQGFEIEPRMTAGTFWHDDIDTVCPFSHNHHQSRFHRDRCFPEIEHATREKEKYYMEFVCPYRSGFMPTFYSDAGNDFIST
ncbi:hypothetical protein H2200_009799 [Cladophialophora chaetospira]|uniref:Uncharacterized protein n=1 Tax=Cladophialophora chaetospira TaxID=386627 RepID=A0AA38X3D6_9EURO|nr:hypothetical protein H2200_009799 [Cladophialophora chaetospira]